MGDSHIEETIADVGDVRSTFAQGQFYAHKHMRQVAHLQMVMHRWLPAARTHASLEAVSLSASHSM